MEVRYSTSPAEARGYSTAQLRRHYLVEDVFVPGCQLMTGWPRPISPAWSVHSGAATGSYSFVWFMAGENYRFDDMDHIAMADLR